MRNEGRKRIRRESRSAQRILTKCWMITPYAYLVFHTSVFIHPFVPPLHPYLITPRFEVSMNCTRVSTSDTSWISFLIRSSA